jgi:hypothetical protein
MSEFDWLVISGLLLYIAFTVHEIKKQVVKLQERAK